MPPKRASFTRALHLVKEALAPLKLFADR